MALHQLSLRVFCFFSFLLMLGCDKDLWNSPYAEEGEEKIMYTSFSERPKHLDPAISYSSNEWQITNQIYEPLLQYHYLKRPYSLEPLLLQEMPKKVYLDKNHQEIDSSENASYTVYELNLKENIKFQNHPCFAKDKEGKYLYRGENQYSEIKEFKFSDTRELTAHDVAYQIKRLADPKINSPLYGLLVKYIPDLQTLRKELSKEYLNIKESYPEGYQINLNEFKLDSIEVISNYKFKIKIQGDYPQFIYWLSTPFFSPMPWEAIEFYNQPNMNNKNISLDWFPVGTGPFKLTENNPERQIILEKNENFRKELYPSVGSEEDKKNGLLENSGKVLPFLDKVVFSLEKESIPYWSKFLQGYYDTSGISSDNFSYAIDFTPNAGLHLSQELVDKGVLLKKYTSPTTMYWGFNMLDEVVGGYTEEKRNLRQAISIAVSVEEFLNIFTNGRGIPAHGPIPPGIDGNIKSKKYNPYVYQRKDEKIERQDISVAKRLLSEAGYPGGIDFKTQKPLTIYYDTISTGDPDEKSLLAWMQKQFKKLNINLIIRATDYNRFQNKVKSGKVQLFFWGWNADYPDPENFLSLFYGPNGKVFSSGENAVNYYNEEFDKLFSQMNTASGKVRLKLLKKINEVLQKDSPWIWGYHQQAFILLHKWNSAIKVNPLSRNSMKYRDLDEAQRQEMRILWNRPVYLSIFIILLLGSISFSLMILEYRKINRRTVKRFS